MKPARIAFVAAVVLALSISVGPGTVRGHADAIPFRGCAPGDIVHVLTAPDTATISATSTISPTFYSIEPRPGFDPTTASDAELTCYGFPTRPSLPTVGAVRQTASDVAARLTRWTTEMKNFHYVVPVISHPETNIRGFDARSGGSGGLAALLPARRRRANRARPRALVHNPEGFFNWTGYVALSGDNNNFYYTYVDGEWTVPSASFGPNGTDQGIVTP